MLVQIEPEEILEEKLKAIKCQNGCSNCVNYLVYGSGTFVNIQVCIVEIVSQK